MNKPNTAQSEGPSAYPQAATLEFRDVSKRYGDQNRAAVDHLSLTVPAGEICVLVGPSGCGKTTAMRMVNRMIEITDGDILLDGHSVRNRKPAELRREIGYVIQQVGLFPHHTIAENIATVPKLMGWDKQRIRGRIDELLELVELRGRADDRVGGYSQGMRQRLGLAASLLRDPRLLILDEPTNGLDPAGIRDMRALIKRLAGEGMTVFLSSHLLAEVEELCTRVAIINNGRVVYEGALSELHAGASPRYRLRTTDPERAREICGREPRVRDLKAEGDELSFSADEQTVVRLSRTLIEAGLGIAALVPETATLESLFFQLTEHAAADDSAGP